jgi:type IV secretory pathway VirD2 relaxase
MANRAYGPQTDEADLDAFKERCADDRHHFRFIVSPEDGAELDDLRTYTRHLMSRMEADLGTRLDWVAVDHWNTDNPHTHLIVRGRDDTGKDLIIAGDYIADGFRHRAAELATEWLGPRTELEIQQTLQREVEQERWTSLDRTLQREAGEDGRVHVERLNEPRLQRQRLLLIGRLQRLQRLGLADEVQPGTWAIHADAEKTLRALGERGDIIRTMQRAMSGQPRELAVFEPGDDGRNHPRPRGREGLADELHDRGYLVIDGVDGKAHYVALNARDELANYPTGAVVEVKGSAEACARPTRTSPRWRAMACTAPIITWRSSRAGPSPAATRRKSSRLMSAGWKPCAGPASWSAWPKGYGRCRTTWPSVAAIRRAAPGRRSRGAEIAPAHRAAGPRHRRDLA